MAKYEDVTLTPGFAYVEVYAGYNNRKDGSPITTKTGFPMCSLSVNVVDKDANVGKKTVWVPSNMEAKIINIENAFGIANFFDSKTSRFNVEKLIGRAAGVALKHDDTYGVNFEMFVPIIFYEHITSSADKGNAKQLLKGKDGVREMYTKVDSAKFDDDIPF